MPISLVGLQFNALGSFYFGLSRRTESP